jgi:hypothetical protein
LKSAPTSDPFLTFELTTASFFSWAEPTLLRGNDTAA